MAIVAGVDFGTLSARVTLMDTEAGTQLGAGVASYPLKTRADDPHFATQAHADHMDALVTAMRGAIEAAGIDGREIAALACDTTGSSVVFVDDALRPVADYYLWCDHRAHREAAEITAAFRASGHEALDWCGGIYSHEWGYAKVLHFLRHNPAAAGMATALEHCDMVAATLSGVTRVADLKRSACGMGHKWMWNPRWGGLPPQEILATVDPRFEGINDRLGGEILSSEAIAGTLSSEWADRLGLAPGIPIPVGAFDAHWDSMGAGCQMGDIVNVVGTSTCVVALGPAGMATIPGVCGIVPGSVHPSFMGIEAGQSATGDVFDAIARRAGRGIADLSAAIAAYRPGQTGLLRVGWDNGDRTVLVRPDLGGITLGWSLQSTAADELFAAIEGMALHVRIILERMGEGGVPAERVINAGGVPQKNDVLNQVYANVLGRDILVPTRSPVGVGSCLFAGLAAGALASLEEAQARLCPPMRVFTPDPAAVAVYDRLHALFRDVYFAFGEGRPADLARVLPTLQAIRAEAS
ncbi:ribulokinase [Acuticoccus kandeliae]|uniref:ribulokinase n=1 Tax=Acuticoccus kandeliae TaxID=2073160 RepID=UPI000D3E9323|nr:ribulokinase [Acuticoccus kandeliae]